MTQPLQRLHALAGHFDVRLQLAKSLSRRIQRDGLLIQQRMEIREQTLGLWNAVGHDDEESRRQTARERRDEGSVGRAGQSGDAQLPRRCGERVEYARERRQAFDSIEQTR